jgi:geranylgeranyl pyrophosphate synthase
MGDMLYTAALKALAGSLKPAVMKSLLETVSKMCLGQLLEKPENNNDKRAYLNMIKLKTGLLMGFSCTGISCAGKKLPNAQYPAGLFNFGVHTGMFYQMADDAVDNDSGAVITDEDLESEKRLAVNELEVFPSSVYKTGLLEFLDYISRYKNDCIPPKERGKSAFTQPHKKAMGVNPCRNC